MEYITVSTTVQSKLCTSCGICKGICPKQCISWSRDDGLYLPHIDNEQCIHCGLCASVCPGLGHVYKTEKDAVTTVTGQAMQCFNAWSKDPEVRHNAASGGVVSTLIGTLLTAGAYDVAFCVDSYDYRKQLTTHGYTAETFCSMHNTPKSRYLPVSHEETIAYIKNNRDDRVIIVGTPCALRGFEAVFQKLRLNREQYLLIGLFCDRVFNYNLLSYFEDTFCDGKRLSALHFKNKESGGWPGNMKFFPEQGKPFYVSKDERQKVKDYFMPERCLYCVDKLNVCADISLGDNYTGQNSSELGSNSAILRTQRGINAWEIAQKDLAVCPIDLCEIQKAQDLNWRLNNLYCGDLKTRCTKSIQNLNPGVPRELNFKIFDQRWHDNLKKVSAGQHYDQSPQKLRSKMQHDTKEDNCVIAFIKRGYYFLKRKIV